MSRYVGDRFAAYKDRAARREAEAKRPRKDYGCPLYIYSDVNCPGYYAVMPPRSRRVAVNHTDSRGHTACLFLPPLYVEFMKRGPHLGQRIHWQDLPPAVQAAVRASFLGEYCPKEGA